MTRQRSVRDGLAIAGLLFAAYLFEAYLVVIVAPTARTVGFRVTA